MPAPGYHYIENGSSKISRKQFNQYARKYGLPAKGFWQITKGESAHNKYVEQHDPGDGMVGYGLFQLTPNAWGKDSTARREFDRLGGVRGMRNVENQFKMARLLYKSAGNSFKPWYGTKYLTDRSGEGKLGPIRKGAVIKGGSSRLVGGTPASQYTVAGVDNSATRQQLKFDYLENSHDPDALLNLAYGLRGAQDTPSRTIYKPGTPGRKVRSAGQGASRPGGRLLELFWQGKGGIDVKDGQVEPQGFVSGHTDHVHVASSRKAVVRLGNLAEKMGLHVGENPHFGGVNPVHVNGSYHYKGKAIDVSGDPAKMRKFAHTVAKLYGV